MTLNEMNTYFEDRGFEVDRTYQRVGEKSAYKFTITKDGRSITRTFEYPNCSVAVKNCRQEEFLDDTIRAFDTVYPGLKADLIEVKQNFKWDENALNKMKDFWLQNSIHGVMGRGNGKTLLAKEILNSMYGVSKFSINNVIFNDPATIVLWSDGTKTVVKCQDDDVFDPEKGLAMAISKKALGNKGNYCNELKKWLPKEEEKKANVIFEPIVPSSGLFSGAIEDTAKAFDDLKRAIKRMNKKNSIQKAYDILVAYRDGVNSIKADQQISPDRDVFIDINEVIGYLDEALED